MVEIRYGDLHSTADLAGLSIAYVRQQYDKLLGIPGKAGVKLNEQKIYKYQEAAINLNDNDIVCFETKKSKVLLFIFAFFLILITTMVPLVFASTTATTKLLTAEKNSIANVEAASTVPHWNVWGKYKGATDRGEIFKITPATGFSGDMAANILIGNTEELAECYRVLVFQVSIYEDDGTGLAADTSKQIGTTEYLILSNDEISINLTGIDSQTSPFWVCIDSGFYITHTWGSYSPTGNEDPSLFCDIVPISS